MKRDDLRALDPHHRAEESFRRAFNATRPVTDAEALDAIGREAALRHWLTDPCPDCLNGVEAIPNGIGDPIATGSCRTCEGRGRLPVDGVALQTILTSAHEERYAFVVPLSMLEGNDT